METTKVYRRTRGTNIIIDREGHSGNSMSKISFVSGIIQMFALGIMSAAEYRLGFEK